MRSLAILLASLLVAGCKSVHEVDHPRLNVIVVGGDASDSAKGKVMCDEFARLARGASWDVETSSLIDGPTTIAVLRNELVKAVRRLRPHTQDSVFIYIRGRAALVDQSQRLVMTLGGSVVLDLGELAHQLLLLDGVDGIAILDTHLEAAGRSAVTMFEQLAFGQLNQFTWVIGVPEDERQQFSGGVDVSKVLNLSIACSWKAGQDLTVKPIVSEATERMRAVIPGLPNPHCAGAPDAVLLRSIPADAR